MKWTYLSNKFGETGGRAEVDLADLDRVIDLANADRVVVGGEIGVDVDPVQPPM